MGTDVDLNLEPSGEGRTMFRDTAFREARLSSSVKSMPGSTWDMNRKFTTYSRTSSKLLDSKKVQPKNLALENFRSFHWVLDFHCFIFFQA